MGSQQLLLIVVGVVIIAIMIAVGMTMVADQGSSSNRDEIANDLAHFSALARAYYRRPAAFGGGERSFKGLTIFRVTSQPHNYNGTYSMVPDPAGPGDDHVTMIGIGNQLGLDGTPVKVVMKVYADSSFVDETQTN